MDGDRAMSAVAFFIVALWWTYSIKSGHYEGQYDGPVDGGKDGGRSARRDDEGSLGVVLLVLAGTALLAAWG